MKRFNRIYLILGTLALLTLFALAFAQAVEPNWNATAWGGSLLAFAGGVSLIVSLIRRYAWKSLDGEAVKGVAIAVGAVVGAGLALVTGAYEGSLVSGVANGVLAGLGSFLGVDWLRDITTGQGTAGKA